MYYSNSPIHFVNDGQLDLMIERPLTNVYSVIDNWVDTVVFTCIRRFKADEEFGFSFWDNEFIAMNLVDFNHGADFKIVKRKDNREEKVQMSRAGKECPRQHLVLHPILEKPGGGGTTQYGKGQTFASWGK